MNALTITYQLVRYLKLTNCHLFSQTVTVFSLICTKISVKNLPSLRFIEIWFYQTNSQVSFWMVIVCDLQLPSKVNLVNLVSLFACLYGKMNFDKNHNLVQNDWAHLLRHCYGLFARSLLFIFPLNLHVFYGTFQDLIMNVPGICKIKVFLADICGKNLIT